jgi:malate synthase
MVFGASDRGPVLPAPQHGVSIAPLPPTVPGDLFSRETIEFLGELARRFEPRRRELIARRGGFRALVRAGGTPGFLDETREVRAGDWRVPPPPPDLIDRRVEITGPVDRKMIVNALNSGAKVYMADFEDAHAPTWAATVEGQSNLIDAIRRRIDFATPEGKEYRLRPSVATLMTRPRGWHLIERHVEVDGQPISASLFDFGAYFALNARELVRRGTAPYFYLPKMEHHLEARLWNDVFDWAEAWASLPSGTVRATALIETLPAAFQMDEVLHALRPHSVGLNCGRWDYLFSFLKQFQDVDRIRFPDREQLGMATPFLTAYSHLLIRTCHRRGAHAMGGMAAQIPIKDDPAAHAAAIAKVVADKEREVQAGHDGTWVAHPALVPIAQEVFDRGMPTPNQIGRPPPGEAIGAAELLAVPVGTVTDDGIHHNARVAVRYLDAWLRGTGCVPIDHLMEDAATAEIARSELWTWVHHGGPTPDGRPVPLERVNALFETEARALADEARDGRMDAAGARAVSLLEELTGAPVLEGFITAAAYPYLEETPPRGT